MWEMCAPNVLTAVVETEMLVTSVLTVVVEMEMFAPSVVTAARDYSGKRHDAC